MRESEKGWEGVRRVRRVEEGEKEGEGMRREEKK